MIHVHPCYYGFRTAEDQNPLPWEKACCPAAAPLVSQLDLANIKCDLGAAKRELADVPARLAQLEAGVARIERQLAEIGLQARQNNRILEAARKRKLGKYIF